MENSSRSNLSGTGSALVNAFSRPTPPDSQLRDTFAQLDFVTSSDGLIPLLRNAYKAASVSDVTILLEGETGSGKQVLARAIHGLDQKRRSFPFVTVNCCAVTEALAESELFGHHRGAFTGAVSDRHGLFHAANRGTLLLDDVNDLPLHVQAKLLDVIQRGVVRPVGCDQETPVDVRIIAASNQSLRSLVTQNRFRLDLYHRLNVIHLQIPPLRERQEDLEPLLLAFANRYSSLYGPIEAVEPELLGLLRGLPLSGNVRELENIVQRMLFGKTHGSSLRMADWVVMEPGDEGKNHCKDPLGEAARTLWDEISQRGLPFAKAMRLIEKRVIETALRSGARTRREIAIQLRTSERTLYHKMRVHQLGERPGFTNTPRLVP